MALPHKRGRAFFILPFGFCPHLYPLVVPMNEKRGQASHTSSLHRFTAISTTGREHASIGPFERPVNSIKAKVKKIETVAPRCRAEFSAAKISYNNAAETP